MCDKGDDTIPPQNKFEELEMTLLNVSRVGKPSLGGPLTFIFSYIIYDYDLLQSRNIFFTVSGLEAVVTQIYIYCYILTYISYEFYDSFL